MKFAPYPFQAAAVDHAVQRLRDGTKQLYAAPTGSGKSVVELLVQGRINEDPDASCWIVTPREEIAAGMLDKLGCSDTHLTDATLERYRISTPIRLRNRLISGALRHPTALVFDEGHHHSAETWQQLDLLTGLCPSVAYTATPYRGSPRSTRDFLAFWGEPLWLITIDEAAAEGYVSMPSFRVLPLVDDDLVEVSGGEFSVVSLESATVDRLADLAEQSQAWRGEDSPWDRPTLYSLPSTECCRRLHRELAARGLLSAVVSAETPREDRRAVFAACEQRILAVLHINVVSEGVDMRLRRLVDAAPTLSPVRFVQQLGRITRPVPGGEPPPEYVCTNRNILRHAYAMEGAVPVSAVVAAEASFGPTQRAHSRALGLEAIGRFKPASVKLVSGATLYMYSLSAVAADGVTVQYCCLVPPTSDPLWASKVNRVEAGAVKYGSWRACEPPQDLHGFCSVPPSPVSEKQARWWARSAARHGLDPSQEPDRKSFQSLPVLSDLGVRL